MEHPERRRAADAPLRESEERLRFSLEAGRLGFWEHDMVTGGLICSDLCRAHLGLPPDVSLTHRDVVAALHPDDRDHAVRTINSAIERREAYDLEYRVIHPDGAIRWLMVRGRATYDADGRALGTHGVTLDVTQRKAAEVLQAAQAERLRLISESAGHLLAVEDSGAGVAQLFGRLRDYLGLNLYLHHAGESADELRLVSQAGLSGELDGCDVPARNAAASRQAMILRGPQALGDEELRPLHDLGVRACACFPLIIGERLLGTLTFASAGQDAFGEDDAELLRTISHYVAAAQERARVAEGLREAARRKDEFLAMLAHELRNPLSPVSSALEIMRSGARGEQQERARTVVQRQLRHMTRLIDDLLDVSRITNGKIRLQRERVDLVAAVESAVESVRGFVVECGHRLEVDLPTAPVWVDVDPVRLEQVVTNLLNNAAKYTGVGGVIQVCLEARGSDARLSVRDNGIGIAPELLGQIWDLFTQGEQGLERSQGGLGLGLTLVRSLVHLHGGTVAAHSGGLGRGSEFVVTLPLLAEIALDSAPTQVSTAPSRNGNGRRSTRVLVVDDNRDSAETLAELAEIWGFEVSTAYDGLSALERARETEPEFIFLDIGMPGLNGYEVARRLREDPRFASSTLVALTGYGQDEDLARSREAGFDHHLVKPVDTGRLEALLRSAPKTPE